MTEEIKTRKKTGNKPKQLTEKIVYGYPVGRAKIIVPPEEVQKLAELGCKDHEIANWFSIDHSTLTYNFKSEILKGRESLKQSLRKAQLQLALGGNCTMLIWLGKNILGQSDKLEVYNTDETDDELANTDTEVIVDALSKLRADE